MGWTLTSENKIYKYDCKCDYKEERRYTRTYSLRILCILIKFIHENFNKVTCGSH